MGAFLLRLGYNIIGKLIMFPVIAYTLYKKQNILPTWAYYFDNAEDGFTGNKRGWYDGYLGLVAKDKGLLHQTWLAYRWSTWRNPAWNLRFHPTISIDVEHAHIAHTGNTVKHDYVQGKQWYNVIINGKYKSYFRLIPISITKSLYLRWGWKVYPEFYVTGRRVPKYKRRSLWTISIRVRERLSK